MGNKTFAGNFFEDFRVGQVIRHATPRTITEGDVALYTALYGPRFAINSSDEFARGIGLARAPVDDILAFHIVFGKTVPDVSLNAVANLGYANGKFGVPVFPGDTLTTTSTVTGLKQNSNGKTGVVYVNSVGKNQHGHVVLDYTRWVMVNKKDGSKPEPEAVTASSLTPSSRATFRAVGVALTSLCGSDFVAVTPASALAAPASTVRRATGS